MGKINCREDKLMMCNLYQSLKKKNKKQNPMGLGRFLSSNRIAGDRLRWRQHGMRESLGWVMALPFPSCASLGKTFNLSQPCFRLWKMRGLNGIWYLQLKYNTYKNIISIQTKDIFKYISFVLESTRSRDWWLSELSIQLRLRSRSHGSWVRVRCRALCCQHRACLGSSVSLSLCPSSACSLSLSPSQNI